jgi:hypothetical protein
MQENLREKIKQDVIKLLKPFSLDQMEKMPSKDEMIESSIKRADFFTLALVPKRDPHLGAAWRPWLWMLEMYIDPYTKARTLDMRIAHELTHFAQSYISMSLYDFPHSKNRNVGLPPRKVKTPQFEQNDYKDRAYAYPGKSYTEVHGLDDIEFYPILLSIVRYVKEIFKANFFNKPRAEKIVWLKRYVENEPHLRMWRQSPEGRKKYQKAVQEIFKQLEL